MILTASKHASKRQRDQLEKYRLFLNSKGTNTMATPIKKPASSKATNAPVFKSRVGSVTASVWENTSKEGTVFYSASIQKSYKDEKDAWQNTDSLNAHDCLSAAKALDLAHTFILEQYAPE
jgi:hypothetical protein